MTAREQGVNQQLRELDDAHRLGRINRAEYRARRRRALETLYDASAVVTARKTLLPQASTTMPRTRGAQHGSPDEYSASGHQALASLLSMRPTMRWMAIVAIPFGIFLIAALVYWLLRG